MAKRFTDTNKYKNPFTRGLQGAYKLLWDYLYHECDHAGIWIVDFEIAQMYLGSDMKVSREKALQFFNQDEVRVVEIDNGKKWFMPSFIELQYGTLKENNKVHESIIKILKRFSLINEDLTLIQFKPHTSPLQGAKDKDKEMDKEKDKEKGKKQVQVSEIVYPFSSESFMKMWNNWIVYKKEQFNFTYKSAMSEQGQLKQLAEMANGSEKLAIELIENAISKSWKGIYPIDNKTNGSGAKKQVSAQEQVFNQYFGNNAGGQ